MSTEFAEVGLCGPCVTVWTGTAENCVAWQFGKEKAAAARSPETNKYRN